MKKKSEDIPSIQFKTTIICFLLSQLVADNIFLKLLAQMNHLRRGLVGYLRNLLVLLGQIAPLQTGITKVISQFLSITKVIGEFTLLLSVGVPKEF